MRPQPTDISEVVVFEPRVFEDSRGAFFETWNRETFAAIGWQWRFVQDNHSFSKRHALRGLHYQVDRPQGKLVRVATGRVFDVAVDLRRSSPTFGRWVGIWLSEENRRLVWIPPGFAHGFYVASEGADFLYKCTELWSPEHDRTLLWNDPEIAIDWPLPSGVEPLVSDKDLQGASFAEAELYD